MRKGSYLIEGRGGQQHIAAGTWDRNESHLLSPAHSGLRGSDAFPKLEETKMAIRWDVAISWDKG
jgi:hypothetical protein